MILLANAQVCSTSTVFVYLFSCSGMDLVEDPEDLGEWEEWEGQEDLGEWEEWEEWDAVPLVEDHLLGEWEWGIHHLEAVWVARSVQMEWVTHHSEVAEWEAIHLVGLEWDLPSEAIVWAIPPSEME